MLQKNTQVSKFSLGMKQRLAITRCISHNPKILLLDESINGLDPVAIKDVRELFLNLKKNGTTIILSSHILIEILQTAESIVVIANGNLQQIGTIAALKEQQQDEIENYLIERMRGKNARSGINSFKIGYNLFVCSHGKTTLKSRPQYRFERTAARIF